MTDLNTSFVIQQAIIQTVGSIENSFCHSKRQIVER